MRRPPRDSIASRPWRHVVAGLLAIALAVPAAAVLGAWSGLYDVAASSGHWEIVDRFLRFGMEQSVRRRAPDVVPPPLADEDRIGLGAAHYHAGCAYCHGAPGLPVSPVAGQMLPPPPDLADRVGRWTDPELFRLVMHGIKYAGMPAWPAQGRDDEVWTVVAFLRRLPQLDAQGYRAIALGDVRIDDETGRQLATRGSGEDAIGACARCHGAGTRGPDNRFVPRLHAQPGAFLARALREYVAGERPSGIMQTAAHALPSDAIERVAAYYAGLAAPPASRPPAETGASLDAGRRLASDGDPAARVPACLPCHGTDALATYPRLAGQPAAYLAGHLRAWQHGPRARTDADAIMAPIARRLTPRQVDDVSAYFESLR